jgi:arginine decarboxylase-like protein
MTADSPERLIVCNGFKDDSYLEAVIIATKLGRTIIPVVENFSELPAILRIAEKYNVRPRIGVRVKLASEGSGKWRESAGDKSKFGLFITEILEAVEILREKNMLDCLQLVHCHPGQPAAGHPPREGRHQRTGATCTRSSSCSARGCSTSTWAAASASTTTAAARTSPRR